MTDRESTSTTELVRREDGQTMAEYGVVLGVIVLGVIVTLGLLATGVSDSFTDTATRIAELAS